MDLNNQIGPLLVKDYLEQNPARLAEWFDRFPEAEDILIHEIGEAPIKHALRECLWVSLAFLLQCPTIKNKALQVQTGRNNDHAVCPMLIQSHVQNLDSAKFKLLMFLQERVRL